MLARYFWGNSGDFVREVVDEEMICSDEEFQLMDCFLPL